MHVFRANRRALVRGWIEPLEINSATKLSTVITFAFRGDLLSIWQPSQNELPQLMMPTSPVKLDIAPWNRFNCGESRMLLWILSTIFLAWRFRSTPINTASFGLFIKSGESFGGIGKTVLQSLQTPHVSCSCLPRFVRVTIDARMPNVGRDFQLWEPTVLPNCESIGFIETDINKDLLPIGIMPWSNGIQLSLPQLIPSKEFVLKKHFAITAPRVQSFPPHFFLFVEACCPCSPKACCIKKKKKKMNIQLCSWPQHLLHV